MLRFEHFGRVQTFEVPTVMQHGTGAVASLGQGLQKLGVQRPLVVTDPGVVGVGLLDPVLRSLKEANLEPVVFDRVQPDPPTTLVAEGSRFYRQERCDGLVGLGGGSSMDCAKAIGVEISHDGPVLEYEAAEGKKPMVYRIPPLATVPTTAGTGSEVTQWAVITDPERRYKFNVGGPLIAAHLTVIDPELHVSMPPHVTAATGLDAICHAVECYTCHYAQPQTDAVALLAIEYAAKYLRRATANGQDIEARYAMAMSAMLAGLSYGSESAGAVHAMAQSLGGMVRIMHGQCVSAMMVPVFAYNWIGCPERFARIAQAMGEDTHHATVEEAAQMGVSVIAQLVHDLDIPSLGEQGVPQDQIREFAEAAFNDPQTIGNPRDLDVAAYERIYKRCFEV